MSDLIRREDVIKIIDEEIKAKSDYLQHNAQIDIMYKVQELPTVQAKPVVHGEWEKTRLAGEYICSNCQSLICSGFTRMGYEQYKFCPECGADMRKKVG